MCVCVGSSQKGQKLLLWLSPFNSVNLHEVFSLCPDMLLLLSLSTALCFSFPPSDLHHIPSIAAFCGEARPSFIFALFVLCHLHKTSSGQTLSEERCVLRYKNSSCDHNCDYTTLCFSYLVCAVCAAMIHGRLSCVAVRCRPISRS